jgi:hypothetical protein
MESDMDLHWMSRYPSPSAKTGQLPRNWHLFQVPGCTFRGLVIWSSNQRKTPPELTQSLVPGHYPVKYLPSVMPEVPRNFIQCWFRVFTLLSTCQSPSTIKPPGTKASSAQSNPSWVPGEFYLLHLIKDRPRETPPELSSHKVRRQIREQRLSLSRS